MYYGPKFMMIFWGFFFNQMLSRMSNFLRTILHSISSICRVPTSFRMAALSKLTGLNGIIDGDFRLATSADFPRFLSLYFWSKLGIISAESRNEESVAGQRVPRNSIRTENNLQDWKALKFLGPLVVTTIVMDEVWFRTRISGVLSPICIAFSFALSLLAVRWWLEIIKRSFLRLLREGEQHLHRYVMVNVMDDAHISSDFVKMEYYSYISKLRALLNQ